MISDICSAERRFNFRAHVLRPTALAALSAAGISPARLCPGTRDAGPQKAPAQQECSCPAGRKRLSRSHPPRS